MQAIILAGGKGTRMAESEGRGDYALKSEKIICGKPIIEWQLEQLAKGGINNVTIYTSEYTPVDAFKEYVGNNKYGIDLEVKKVPD